MKSPPQNPSTKGPELTGRLLQGRYRILSALGRGGMGAVYTARDTHLANRKVVVKLPHAEIYQVETLRIRFQQEIETLVKLQHPYIVPIFDVGEVDGFPFAVLAYLAGGSLKDRLKSQGEYLAPEQVLEWLPTVARALDFIHRQGYIHRDVKPANILFDSEGHVHLADFGIVRGPEARDYALTQVGETPGVPAFMPPEVIQNPEAISPAYDQYSLAVCVFLALGGAFPHHAESTQSLFREKATRTPLPLADLAPHAPRQAVQVIVRALAPNPSSRFGSCTAFARAFEASIRHSQRSRIFLPESVSGGKLRSTVNLPALTLWLALLALLLFFLASLFKAHS